MEIHNLTDENVTDLEEKLSEMQKGNPDIEHRVYQMNSLQETLEKGKAENEMLQEISDKLDTLNNKLDMIFGSAVLINGQFVDPGV